MARELIVRIIGDERQYRRSLDKAGRATKGFERDMNRTFRGVIAGSGAFQSLGRSVAFASSTFLGGVGLAAAFRSVVSSASDLNEEVNKSSVVFGQNAAEILNWSEKSASAFGLSQEAALAAAGAFGAMLKTSGVAGNEISGMSETLVKLASDMASFNNEDPSDMLDRLRSGLAGEAEPLRRFGILLSEAAVQTEAVRIGLTKQGAKLTEGQKVLARYSLILKQTGIQQGDFARTSGGLANQQRILRAQITDLAAKLGSVLLPIITRYVTRLTDWLEKTNKSGELQRRLNETMDDLARILPKVEHGVSQVADAVGKVRDAFGGWDNALKTLGLLVVLTKLRKLQGKSGGKGGGGGSGLAGIGALLLGLPGIATVAAAALVNASDKMSNAVNTVYNNIARFDHAVLKFFHVDLPTGLDKSKAATINLAKAIATVGNALSGLGGGAIGAVGAAIATAAPGGAIAGTRGAPQRKEFKLTTQLQLAKAQAALTEGTADDVRVAKQIVAFINKLRAARRLAPKALIAALGELAGALDTIRSATKEAAEKTAEAAKKHAEELKRASEKQQQAAAEAARKIREATENARTLIGDLFQGPVLAPTEQQRKEQLGVPGIDIGRLTADVTAQTTQFLEFMKDLATIRKRGGSKQLVADLRRQGLESAPVAATIAGAKPADFRKLLGALEVRERAIRKAATRPLRVFVTVNLDGKTVAANVTAHQQRNARHQGRQRRGRNGGQALGLA